LKTYGKNLIVLLLTVALTLSFSSCVEKKAVNLWENATYTEDAEIGNGQKVFTLSVSAQDKEVVFTVKTDKKTVGEALLEHKLISGEIGTYGLYVKFVNGIEADYSKTQSFWAFLKNGESLLTGVDSEDVTEGARYEFVYTVQ